MSISKVMCGLLATVATVGLASAADAAPLKVAAISGYFSQGFGVAIVNGLNKAKEDFGIDLKLIDTGNRALDYEEQFLNVAQSGEYDIVFVMGWELVDALTKAHAEYPNQRFVFIDGVLDSPTMTYIDFAENEGSYVAGAMAALMTSVEGVDGINEDKTIGFVGGRDIPVIRSFLAGYEQGAKAADPEVEVKSVFAGTFDDPARGNELAMALYGDGADIVYNVAGPTGEGVLQAAGTAGAYAIGVDIDQCDVSPGAIIASMLKKADVAVYDLIKRASAGEAIADGAYDFNLKADGVGLLLCPEVSDKIPDEVKAKIDAMRQEIVDGKITVDSVM
jgi:basic membrane protein A